MTEDRKTFNDMQLKFKRKVLIERILNDTLKYSDEDTYHTVIGTMNKNPYGELYVINEKQYLRLDIAKAIVYWNL
jgi:hypothetical protein